MTKPIHRREPSLTYKWGALVSLNYGGENLIQTIGWLKTKRDAEVFARTSGHTTTFVAKLCLLDGVRA